MLSEKWLTVYSAVADVVYMCQKEDILLAVE